MADVSFFFFVQVAKAVLSGARAGSLVLMDEMGSGTDPMQGAALAQSLLEVCKKNTNAAPNERARKNCTVPRLASRELHPSFLDIFVSPSTM